MKNIIEHFKLPGYVRIAQDMNEKIEKGVYEPNTLLPSERELAVKYKVSTIVINQALNMLSTQGAIEKVARKGSFVRAGIRKNSVSNSKIVIHGIHAPLDINERQEEFVKLLNRQFPKVKIEYVQGDYTNRKATVFPDEHDIIICPEKIFANFALENRLEPLGDLDDQFDKSEYFSQAFQQCKTDGMSFGLPLNINPSVLYCNQRILEKVDIATDLNTLTWKTFIKACEKIKKELPEVFPMGYFEFSSCWWENFFYTHGLDIISKDRFEADIFTPPGLAALDVMKNITKNGLSDNLTIRRNALDLLNEDKVAFFIFSSRMIKDLKDFSKWDLVPVPMASVQSSAANSFLMAINAKSENIKICKEILSYLLSKKFQLWLAEEQAICPIHKEALNKTFNTSKVKALYSAAGNAKMFPNNVECWEIKSEIGKAIYQFINGDIELAEMEKEINNKFYFERQEWNSLKMLGIA